MKNVKDGAERGSSQPQISSATETLQLFSHDIRSAMSDVVGGLRLIDLDDLAPETRMQFDRVRAAGDELAALVDAALMAAAGETRIQQAESDVDVQAWLNALTKRWFGRAREAGRVFSMEIEHPMPDRLRLPQMTLDRIVGNLISNALEHAGGDEVKLKLRGEPKSGLTISVTDSGLGYPDHVLAQIGADSWVRTSRSKPGGGLGLKIVAELTRQFGGQFDLSNAEAGGGVATVEVPEGFLIWHSGPSKPSPPPDLSGLRLLVAEDNLTNQTILRQLLGKMRAEVVIVDDGVAALDMLDRQSFDLALIDIEMPRLSGLEVMRAVRAREDAVAQMPLVALTAYVLRDNREAIFAAGADGIIGKPILSGAEFGQAILRHSGKANAIAPAPKRAEPSHVQNMDHTRFAELLQVAGPSGREELLARLAEDLEGLSIALDAAVTARDVIAIRAQTHILVAVAGAVGADRLLHLAEALNVAANRGRLAELDGLYAPCRAHLEELRAFVGAKISAVAHSEAI